MVVVHETLTYDHAATGAAVAVAICDPPARLMSL